jgi:serine phosphatase RsbU (regulator of sigma subunit)
MNIGTITLTSDPNVSFRSTPGWLDGWKSPGLIFLTVFLMFFGLPLTLALIFGTYTLGLIDQQEQFRLNQHHERVLDTLVVHQENGSEVENLFRRLLVEIRRNWADNDRARTYYNDCTRELGHPFPAFFFQHDRVTYRSPQFQALPLYRALIKAVAFPATRTRAASRRLDPILRKTFGPHISLAFLQKRNGEFVPVQFQGVPGLLFLQFRPDGSSSLLIIPRIPEKLWRGFLEQHRKTLPWRRYIGKGVHELGVWQAPQGLQAEVMETAWTMASRSPGTFVDYRGFRWYFCRDRWGVITTLAIPASRLHSSYERLRGLLILGTLLFTLLGLRISRDVASGNLSLIRSIRTQLWALFFYVSFIPLSASLILGWVALQDRRDQYKHAAFRQGVERLQSLESGYYDYRQKMLHFCRELRNHPIVKAGDQAGIKQLVTRLGESGLIDVILILDAQFQPLYAKVRFPQVQALLTNMGRFLTREYASPRLSRQILEQGNPMEMMMEEISKNDDMGWSTLAQFRNRIHELALGRNGMDIFWDVYPELASGPVFIVIAREQGDLLERYFRDSSHRLFRTSGMYYLDQKAGEIRPETRSRLAPLLSNLLLLSNKRNELLQRELIIGNQVLWVVATPDGIFQRFALLAIQPAHRAFQALRPFYLSLWVGFLVSVFVSLLSGRLLANLFLVPIQDLTAGLEAIRQRKSDYRIPVRHQNEFGRLAEIFNHTLSELRELEMARVVQAQLLPQQLPHLPGYEIAAFNETATDLGGDYYDFANAPDGRTLFLLGDATGHGISAALAMAVAKAAFTRQLHPPANDREAAPDLSLNRLLTRINQVFFQVLKPTRKFMTMMMGALNPITHRLEVQNAGHTFPLYFHQETGTVEIPELVGFVLGMRQKYSGERAEFEMKPGDFLLLYTDGYTECDMPDGTQFGNAPFFDLVQTLGREPISPDELIKRLLAHLNRVRKPGPLGDDITLLIIRRQAVASE